MFDPSKFGATPVKPVSAPVKPGGFDPSKFGATSTGGTSQDAVNLVNNKLNPPAESFATKLTNVAKFWWEDVKGATEKGVHDIGTGSKRISAGADELAEGNFLEAGKKIAGGAAQGVAGGVMSGVGAIFAPFSGAARALTPKTGIPIVDRTTEAAVAGAPFGPYAAAVNVGFSLLNEGREALWNTGPLKEFAEKYPEAKTTMNDIMDIAIQAKGGKMALDAERTARATGTTLPKDILSLPVGEATKQMGKNVVKTGVTFAKPIVKVAPAFSKAVNVLAKYGTAQATGLNPETISRILSRPEDFSPSAMKEFTRENVAKEAIDAVEQRLEDLSETGKEYGDARASQQLVILPKGTVRDYLGEHKIKINNKGRLIFDKESTPTSPGDRAALQDWYSMYGKDETHTANSFLNMRKGLDTLAQWDSAKTDAANVLAMGLRKTLNKVGRPQIEPLEGLDTRFAEETTDLKQVKKDYFNSNGTLKDNALNKIANLTNRGRNKVLERLEVIAPGIGEKIRTLKAVEDIQAAGGQKVGTYTRSAVTGLGVYALSPTIIVAAILSEPHVATQILRGYGKLLGVKDSVVNRAIRDYESFIKSPKIGLGIEDVSKKGEGAATPKTAFYGFRDYTNRVLDQLVGHDTVSKQFIQDLTNQPELRKPDRDLVRTLLKDEGDTVNVSDFANKILMEQLPLKKTTPQEPRYEGTSLPEELRGPVASYAEHVYESPIKTSASEQHYPDLTDNYFAHTRVEDLPERLATSADDFDKTVVHGKGIFAKRYKPGTTRRVIEVQSDLMQRGNWEEMSDSDVIRLYRLEKTWYEPVIREEFKQALADKKTKLQFPTGETIMKIEGLASGNGRWRIGAEDNLLRTENLKLGLEIKEFPSDNKWVITDVGGDGKFKAVPKSVYSDFEQGKYAGQTIKDALEARSESFDISGKIDTKNAQYVRYEKTYGKFLQKEFGATKITDPQGVTWWEADVKAKELPKPPPPKPEPIPDQEFKVGVSNVAGRYKVQSDAIVAEAQNLYVQGKFPQAQAKYEEAVKFGVKTVNDAFEGTGIKVRARPGFGVFEGSLEPNIDMTAIVPKGKEDLFRFKMNELGDKQLGQKSVLTYRNTESEAIGLIDEARQIYNEPYARFTLKTQAGVQNAPELYALMKKNGIIGGSIKGNGRHLDIINLSHYNKDYEGFSKKLIALEKDLQNGGLLETARRGKAEVWHVGNTEKNAPITYKRVSSEYYRENPGFKAKGDLKTTSKVIERLPTKELITKSEIELIAKSSDISPLEREQVTDALAKMTEKDGRINTQDFASTMREGFLKVTPEKTDKYADYGVDNLNIDFEKPSAIVLRTPVKHGVHGHFGTQDELGHVRTFKIPKKKGIYVSEIQADPFQQGFDLANKNDSQLKIEVQEKIFSEYKAKHGISESETITRGWDTPLSDEQVKRGYVTDIQWKAMKAMAEGELERLKAEAPAKLSSEEKAFQSLASGNKYRRAILENTLVTLRDQGFKEINLPTPSTVARIEWNKGSSEDAIPYQDRHGNRLSLNSDDLGAGDSITYAGEDYTVVKVGGRYGGGDMEVAPSNKVRNFRWSDYVSDEVDNGWENTAYELRRYSEKNKVDITKEITPELAKEMEGDIDDYNATKILEKIVEDDKSMKFEDFEQEVREKIEEGVQQDQLEDVYGSDKVYVDEDRNDPMIYVVEEDGHVETFGQPSSYESAGEDVHDLMNMDTDKSAAEDFGFSKTEMGVLDNYYDLQDNLKALQKETDISVEYVTERNENDDPVTWIRVIPNKNLKKSAFGTSLIK